jgi:hypothetical protein
VFGVDSVEGRFCGVPVQREGVVGVNGTVSKTNSCRTPANPEGSHDCDLKVLFRVARPGRPRSNRYRCLGVSLTRVLMVVSS